MAKRDINERGNFTKNSTKKGNGADKFYSKKSPKTAKQRTSSQQN